jgi:hypothetical protein
MAMYALTLILNVKACNRHESTYFCPSYRVLALDYLNCDYVPYLSFYELKISERIDICCGGMNCHLLTVQSPRIALAATASSWNTRHHISLPLLTSSHYAYDYTMIKI